MVKRYSDENVWCPQSLEIRRVSFMFTDDSSTQSAYHEWMVLYVWSFILIYFRKIRIYSKTENSNKNMPPFGCKRWMNWSDMVSDNGYTNFWNL